MNTTNRGNLVWGAILLTVGVLLFLSQMVSWDTGGWWPLIIIGVGLAFFVGMYLGGKALGPLAIPGSIVTMIGLILFVQNTFNWYETWSYAWALIVCSVGIGLYIWGIWAGNADLKKSGRSTASVGIILFLVFGAIFEIIFNLTGVSNRGGLVPWSIVLIVAGFLQLCYRLYRVIRLPDEAKGDDRDLFWPVFLMGAGTLFLMYSAEFVKGDHLLSLLNLWPLLLIVAGIQVIFGRKNAWASLALGIIFVVILIALAGWGPQLGISLPQPFTFNMGSFSSGPVRERVKGNNEVIQKDYTVSGFDEVVLDGLGQLVITQGGQESLTIEAESNLIPHLTVDVSGNKLVLGVERGYGLTPNKTIVYTLVVKDLTRVNVSGAGDISINGLETSDFTVDSSGMGSYNIKGLSADEVEVNLSGAGSVNISGTANSLTVKLSGVGSLNAGDLKVSEAEARISGAGNATVWATELLSADISGLGNVRYYGSPSVDKNVSGLGNVTRIGDK